jgi:hypothetical protein
MPTKDRRTYGEAAQEQLQAMWDSVCGSEPRTIKKMYLKEYRRKVWIGTRMLGDTPAYTVLGSTVPEAKEAIRQNARWKGKKN